MRIAILGSGISGLSIGQLLKSEHDVTIHEFKEKIGGLIKCKRVNDCLFHEVGGHVFNSKSPKVLNWFWAFFDKEKEFVEAKRNAKILFNEKIVGYPIENHLFELDEVTTRKVISDLVHLQKDASLTQAEHKTFESFLRENFGETLFEIYFEPYNKKIWQTDLSKVALAWLEGKLPMPNLVDILYSNFSRQESDDMVHAHFYYPKNEGSQFIASRLAKGLNILTGCDSSPVILDDGSFNLNGENFEKLIYTGDIRRLPFSIQSILIDNGISFDRISALRSNGTSNLFCETDDTTISWLYIPQSFTKAHRIIYTGNFSETNNRGSKRKTCVVEFSGLLTHEEMMHEIQKLPGNLTPLASNYEPNSYIIQDENTRELINEVKKILTAHNIFLLGRFAEWEYYNMDKAIAAAMLLKEQIF